MTFLDLLILTPELFFINFLLIFLWLSLYVRYKLPSNALSSSFSTYSCFLLFLVITIILNQPFVEASALFLDFIINPLNKVLKIFTLIVSMIVILTCLDSDKLLSINRWDVEVNFVRLLIISASLLIISINDFIYLFFCLEIYSLATYVLIGYRSKISVFSAESSLKYFILGTAFSVLIGYAIAIFYWTTGLTNFTSLELYLTFTSDTAYKFLNFDLFPLAVILLLVTLFFKLAAAPFHFWAPDVYEAAPTTSTYFLFVVPKIALLSILIKLSFLFSLYVGIFALLLSGTLSLLLGAIGGLFQTKLKRLLTYSMINNNGFFLFALAIPNIYGVVFLLFFLVIYTTTLLGLFTSLLSLRLNTTFVSLKNIWSWVNLFFINRVQSVFTSLLLFSSAGIPPLVGFITKFLILFVLILNFTDLHYLVVVALVVAPLSCFYYIRLVKVMGFTKKQNWLFIRPLSNTSAYVLSLCIVSLFLFFICSGTLINIIILTLI